MPVWERSAPQAGREADPGPGTFLQARANSETQREKEAGVQTRGPSVPLRLRGRVRDHRDGVGGTTRWYRLECWGGVWGVSIRLDQPPGALGGLRTGVPQPEQGDVATVFRVDQEGQSSRTIHSGGRCSDGSERPAGRKGIWRGRAPGENVQMGEAGDLSRRTPTWGNFPGGVC